MVLRSDRRIVQELGYNGGMEKDDTDLLAAVRRTLLQAELNLGGTLVVAVSGGPDSTALLHALASLRAEMGLKLVGAHLNHGFRGAEADEDAAYVQSLCARLDISCVLEKIDVPGLRQRRHLSAQAAAREVRHALLRRVAEEVGANWIALGHTRDDRIETVLLHILRGSGLEGLAGIAACDPPLLRPLLNVCRAETEAYCIRHSLAPRHDSSNSKTDYRRNRVRAELLPHLASYYNQRVGDSLLRLSDLAAADADLLNRLALDALPTVTLSADGSETVLEAEGLLQLPLALQRRVLRAAIEEIRGDLRDIGMETTERVLRAMKAGQSVATTLPDGKQCSVEIAISPRLVRIRRLAPAMQTLPWRVMLPFPGRVALPQAALMLETCHAASLTEAFAASGPEQTSLVYSLSELSLPLQVRSWQAGDRIRPRGLGGSKKLQDIYTDRKIRGEERLRFPVLVDANGRVLAVIGLLADESARSPLAAPGRDPVRGEYIVLTWK